MRSAPLLPEMQSSVQLLLLAEGVLLGTGGWWSSCLAGRTCKPPSPWTSGYWRVSLVATTTTFRRWYAARAKVDYVTHVRPAGRYFQPSTDCS